MSIEFITGDSLPVMAGMPEGKFNLVFGSPPYVNARLYLEDGKDLGIARKCDDWIAWMLDITEAAIRVCNGPVIWVVGSKTKQHCYQPAPEGLVYEWWKRGGNHHLWRRCIFHRVGIPGSGGKQGFRADTEDILIFKKPGALPWANNKACGKPCKYERGGEMSYRRVDGKRVNDTPHFREAADGTVKGSHPRNICNTANPGNVVEEMYTATEVEQFLAAYEVGDWCHEKVGGGHMGHPLAHKNEAPFPEHLVERFVLSLCPPGGWVLDPFSGSGTTMSVCCRLGRNGIGIDLRESQTKIAQERCHDLQRELFP